MPYNNDDIIQDEIIKDFFLGRTITENSKKSYIYRLKHYSNWRKQLPSEWIEEADIEQAQNIKLKKRKVKKDLIGYIQYLKDMDFCQNTINGYMASLKAIYYDNDVILPRKLPMKLDKDTLILKGEKKELPTREDVRLLVDSSNIRDKAIFLMQLSSGLSSIDMRRLKYKNLLDSFEIPKRRGVNLEDTIDDLSNREDEELIGWWALRRFKTNIKFYTFNSPESTKALLEYLKWRVRENKPIRSNNDPLFSTQHNKPFGKDGFMHIYKRANIRVGFTKDEYRNRYFVTSHQLREMFSTGLFKKRVEKLRIDFFLGHKINEQDAAYFRSNQEDLYKDYLAALPEVTLEKVKVERFTSHEVKQIVNELNDVKLATGWIMDAIDRDPSLKDAIIKSAEKGIANPPKELINKD